MNEAQVCDMEEKLLVFLKRVEATAEKSTRDKKAI
jgi:hypothetical protein